MPSEGTDRAAVVDPFGHPHHEAYADAIARGRVAVASLIKTAGRALESLDGAWSFAIDLDGEGLR